MDARTPTREQRVAVAVTRPTIYCHLNNHHGDDAGPTSAEADLIAEPRSTGPLSVTSDRV
jgi:hypothetical protein